MDVYDSNEVLDARLLTGRSWLRYRRAVQTTILSKTDRRPACTWSWDPQQIAEHEKPERRADGLTWKAFDAGAKHSIPYCGATKRALATTSTR